MVLCREMDLGLSLVACCDKPMTGRRLKHMLLHRLFFSIHPLD